MNDNDLLIQAGFSTAKMEASSRQVIKSAEKAGKDTAKAFDEGMAKVSSQETVKAHAREIEKLKRQYDPLYAASKRYERELDKINRAEKIGAITASQRAKELKRLNAELEQGALRAQRQGTAMARGAGSARNYGGVMQNVGFQVGDFATQVGAGTSATQALSQQLPQLLGAFGAFGAVAGAGAAILIPLTTALYETVTGAVDLEEQMDALTKTTDAYVAAAEAAETPIETLREKYGDLADEVAKVNEQTLAFTKAGAEIQLDQGTQGFASQFGGLSRTDLVSLDTTQGFWSSLFDKGPAGLVPEIDNTMLTIAEEFGIAREEAIKFTRALERLNDADGAEAQYEALSRLQETLVEIAGSDVKALEVFGGLPEQLGDLLEAAQKQIGAGIDDEDRRVNKLFSTYTERTRELTRLTEDRALAERELRKAQAEGNLERVNQAKQVISGIDEEIEKLTDVKGRLEDLAAGSELAARGFEQVVFDPEDEGLNAAKDLAEQIRKAVLNVGDLNESDLARLENELAGIEDRLKGVIEAANGAGGAMSVAAQNGYAQYVSTRSHSERVTNARNEAEASKSGILDLIGYAEGTDKGRGYNETLDYGRYTGGNVDLINMTLNEVLALQKSMLAHPDNPHNSSAVGRYQIVSKTLRGLISELGLSGNELFDPQMQDRLGMQLVRRRRGQGVEGYRNEWEGLRRVSDGSISQALGTQSIPREDPKLASERQKQIEAETAAREKLFETRVKYSDLLKTRVADAEFESSLIGKSVEEQARLRAEYMLTQEAKRRGIDLNEKVAGSEETYGEAIKRTSAALAQQAAQQENLRLKQDQTSQSAQFFDQIQSTLQNGLIDAIVSGQSFADVLGNVAQMLAKAALQAALFGQGPLATLFGQKAGTGILSGLAGLFGFSEGGFTGAGGKYEPKGVVHGGEYVFSAEAVKRIGVPQLESLHKNLRGYSSGGFVGGSLKMPTMAPQPAQAAPQFTLKNVNVLDPALVGDFLATADGEKLVTNIIRRNLDVINA